MALQSWYLIKMEDVCDAALRQARFLLADAVLPPQCRTGAERGHTYWPRHLFVGGHRSWLTCTQWLHFLISTICVQGFSMRRQQARPSHISTRTILPHSLGAITLRAVCCICVKLFCSHTSWTEHNTRTNCNIFVIRNHIFHCAWTWGVQGLNSGLILFHINGIPPHNRDYHTIRPKRIRNSSCTIVDVIKQKTCKDVIYELRPWFPEYHWTAANTYAVNPSVRAINYIGFPVSN